MALNSVSATSGTGSDHDYGITARYQKLATFSDRLPFQLVMNNPGQRIELNFTYQNLRMFTSLLDQFIEQPLLTPGQRVRHRDYPVSTPHGYILKFGDEEVLVEWDNEERRWVDPVSLAAA